jgi:hypothetical protein
VKKARFIKLFEVRERRAAGKGLWRALMLGATSGRAKPG